MVPSPWRDRAGKFVLLVVSLSVAEMFGELLVRRLAPQILSVPFEAYTEGVRMLRPNVKGRLAVPGNFDVSLTTSPQGFRGARTFASIAPDVLRVAVLGDSFAFGWGAGDLETYPAQLERLLTNDPPPGFASVEVINAGVPGHCMGEKALWFELGVRPLAPQVVVLTVLLDDPDDDFGIQLFSETPDREVRPLPAARRRSAAGPAHGAVASASSFPGYGWLAQHSQLFCLVRRSVSRAVQVTQGVRATSSFATFDEARHEANLARFSGEVRWLDRAVRASGGRLVTVFAPCREEVCVSTDSGATDLRHRGSTMVEVLRRTCVAQQIPFIDLRPKMSVGGSCPLYYPGPDTHPNPLGYGQMASGVADFLRAEAAARRLEISPNVKPSRDSHGG
jgi:lysophospholipase L1-like esterase